MMLFKMRPQVIRFSPCHVVGDLETLKSKLLNGINPIFLLQNTNQPSRMKPVHNLSQVSPDVELSIDII